MVLIIANLYTQSKNWDSLLDNVVRIPSLHIRNDFSSNSSSNYIYEHYCNLFC